MLYEDGDILRALAERGGVKLNDEPLIKVLSKPAGRSPDVAVRGGDDARFDGIGRRREGPATRVPRRLSKSRTRRSSPKGTSSTW